MQHHGAVPADPELTAFQRLSATLLVALSRMPKWLLLVVVLGLTAGGLLLENAIGGILLLLLALFMGWLAIVGWPRLSLVGRLLRILVLGLILYASFTRFL
jgi:Family of unknown function (DUF6703)